MKSVIFYGIVLLLTTCLVDSTEIINSNTISHRKFSIDYVNNEFLMDGKPFRYISGSFHYFRALPGVWRTRLRTMRAAGLNTISTYVEWFLHNPHDDIYNWDGIADLIKFIEIAQEEDFYIILRPGPYICAERQMGGIPYWLLNKYPNIKLRTYDEDYLSEVRKWYSILMPKIKPYLYGNGGKIIMVQIENEYGSFHACDKNYTIWLRDETENYVKGKALLFTTDGPGMLACGSIPDVFTTIDFGADTNVSRNWRILRQYQPQGPLVNSEYYPGWLTHWQENLQTVPTRPIVYTLRKMLENNASVNFYMFFGGTNFGFTAGANDGGPGRYNADITSYDYDAPMTEAGDPTNKYLAIRNVIKDFLPLPDLPIPSVAPKMKLGKFNLRPIINILSQNGRRILGTPSIKSQFPPSFEAFNQNSGLVLYEVNLPKIKRDPVILNIEAIHDRAYVYIDRSYVGILSRENQATKLPISLNNGQKLQILVENQGRINYNIPNDFKGILSEVYLDNFILQNWTTTGYPLEDYSNIENSISYNLEDYNRTIHVKSILKSGPTLFMGAINISEENICDTYLDPSGWGKGIVFINGFNLGRYWPSVGPQITLYVPKEILKQGRNEIVVLEYQSSNVEHEMEFTNVPIFG